MPSVEASASLRDVRVVLDDRVVLREIDLDVGPGLTLVRGPNGAGKTTLLRAIAGLVPLASGTREVRGGVLALGHRPQLLHGLSARENLAFFARFRGSTAEAVDAALSGWGMADDADRPVEHLSAGQRRRASLARLRSEPCANVLLDEPFAELDDEASGLLETAIAELRAAGRTVIVASHAHADLDRGADRTLRLDAGRMSR